MDDKKFVEQFKTLKNKEDLVRRHIKTYYVPYVEKLSNAIDIAKNTTHVEISGKQIYKKNTPSQYFFTIMRIIVLYTDIEFSNDEYIAAYDELNKNEIISMIFDNIPEKEITEFKTLVEMCVNDTYENERDISSLLENKLEAVNMVIGQIQEAFTDVLKQVDIQELMKNLPQKESVDEVPNVIKFNDTKDK